MSHLLVNMEEERNMPGGLGFIDATDILKKGTEDIELGSLLSIHGFTLQDAMSALEIMDPRMDTGMAAPPPPFDPHMPLLPAEVCWILDRALACEMSWHTGLALSQTVYTLQYVHHLADISYPGFDRGPPTMSHYAVKDPERPMELVTLVLRAGVFGLLKCCDLVWRELANDHLFDGEDWNGEKFGVSLCEGVQPETLMNLLEDAVHWLQESPALSSSPWRAPLLQRILLRKNIFQTLAYPSFPALWPAEQNLKDILAGPVPPHPPTTVQNAFDPAIARRLVTFVPTHAVDIPPQDEVWKSVSMWLDGWQEVRRIVGTEDLRSLKVLVSLRSYEGQSPRRSSFLRSLSISTFFNGRKILQSHEPPWLIDRFFWEIAAVDAITLSQPDSQIYEDDRDAFISGTTDKNHIEEYQHQEMTKDQSEDGGKIIDLFEKGVAKLLVDHFNSFYHNRARQRRKLAASLLDWHLAYDQALIVASRRRSSSTSPKPTLTRIPPCIRHTRLTIITDVVFSGFELELYAPDEWVMMYWYAGLLLATQVAVLRELDVSIAQDSAVANPQEARAYVSFHLEYAEALRCFSIAMRDVLYRYASPKAAVDSSREEANFKRRFKWAFVTGYAEAAAQDCDRPDLEDWRVWRNEQKPGDDRMGEAVDNLISAHAALSRLSEYGPSKSGAVFCPEPYRKFMSGLVESCDANLAFLKIPAEIRTAARRDWHWRSSRWFPEVDGAS